jgi:hypothetical protein
VKTVLPFKSCPREQTPRVKAKVFYLQNPITALKIYLKFLEVKQHWDPNLEKAEFLEGKQNWLDTGRLFIDTISREELPGTENAGKSLGVDKAIPLILKWCMLLL